MANIEIFGTLVRNDDNTNRDKIVQGNQVEGGYFVCSSKPTSGVWANGQLCYCTGDKKFYQYNGTTWVPAELATKDELFSGSYNDLTNRPTIPSTDDLATVEYVDDEISNIVSGTTRVGVAKELKSTATDGSYSGITINTVSNSGSNITYTTDVSGRTETIGIIDDSGNMLYSYRGTVTLPKAATNVTIEGYSNVAAATVSFDASTGKATYTLSGTASSMVVGGTITYDLWVDGFTHLPMFYVNDGTTTTEKELATKEYVEELTSDITPSEHTHSYNDLTDKPTIPVDTNQKVKVGSVTFGTNDVVDFVAGDSVTIAGNSTNKTITISVDKNALGVPTKIQSESVYNTYGGIKINTNVVTTDAEGSYNLQVSGTTGTNALTDPEDGNELYQYMGSEKISASATDISIAPGINAISASISSYNAEKGIISFIIASATPSTLVGAVITYTLNQSVDHDNTTVSPVFYTYIDGISSESELATKDFVTETLESITEGGTDASAVSAALVAHEAATNPHGITPAGIGAALSEHNHSGDDLSPDTLYVSESLQIGPQEEVILDRDSQTINGSQILTEASIDTALAENSEKLITNKAVAIGIREIWDALQSGDYDTGEDNVQSDWNEANETSDAFIKNKPTIPTKTSDLTNDSDYATTSYIDGEIDTHTHDKLLTDIERNKLKVIDLTTDAEGNILFFATGNHRVVSKAFYKESGSGENLTYTNLDNIYAKKDELIDYAKAADVEINYQPKGSYFDLTTFNTVPGDIEFQGNVEFSSQNIIFNSKPTINGAAIATETFVTTKIAEAQLDTGDGEIVLGVSDYNELTNKPIENEGDDNSISITDNDGNILAIFDESGLNSAGLAINGEAVATENFVKITELTYGELRRLRDRGELIPGHQYRITDYITYSSLPNTSSAEHQFDIIVTADTNNILNENARACLSKNDNYFVKTSNDISEATWKEEYSTEDFKVLHSLLGDEQYAELSADTSENVITNLTYITNPSGVYVPAALNPSPDGNSEYNRYYYYRGTFVLDGVEYDRWGEYNPTSGIFDPDDYSYLTLPMVNASYTKQKLAKLEAWELKYCLDNDQDRFAWAMPEQLFGPQIPTANGEPLVRQPIFDNFLATVDGNEDIAAYKYAWGTAAGVEYAQRNNDGTVFIYSKYPYVLDGEEVYNAAAAEVTKKTITNYSECKGVIYYLKDEWNNEAFYDFKNILFNRTILTSGNYATADDCDEEAFVYTFNLRNYNSNTNIYEDHDLTLVTPFYLASDEGQHTGECSNNRIDPHYSYLFGTIQVVDYTKNPMCLSNNVCLVATEDFRYPDANSLTSYNYFSGNCCDNTISLGCHHNTFEDCSNIVLEVDNFSNEFKGSNNIRLYGFGHDNTFSYSSHIDLPNTEHNYFLNSQYIIFQDSIQAVAKAFGNTFKYCNHIYLSTTDFTGNSLEGTAMSFYDSSNIQHDGSCSNIIITADQVANVKVASDNHYLNISGNWIINVEIDPGCGGTREKSRILSIESTEIPTVYKAHKTVEISLDELE